MVLYLRKLRNTNTTANTMYHTSPNPITEINKDGLYDDGLFFASKPCVMTGAALLVSIQQNLSLIKLV